LGGFGRFGWRGDAGMATMSRFPPGRQSGIDSWHPVQAANSGNQFRQFSSGKSVMAKGKKRLEVIHLVCSETGDQNYTLRRKSGGEKLKIKKYSPRLRRHTLHNEKKK
jgi:large subunit ribosomal protein L33